MYTSNTHTHKQNESSHFRSKNLFISAHFVLPQHCTATATKAKAQLSRFGAQFASFRGKCKRVYNTTVKYFWFSVAAAAAVVVVAYGSDASCQKTAARTSTAAAAAATSEVSPQQTRRKQQKLKQPKEVEQKRRQERQK